MAHIKTLHSHVALNIITGLSEQMPFTSRIQQKRPAEKQQVLHGAENGTQTRDPQLGRLVLYRLSYFRKCIVPHTSRTHYAFSIRNGRHKQTLNYERHCLSY